jgi:hypothetical protein
VRACACTEHFEFCDDKVGVKAQSADYVLVTVLVGGRRGGSLFESKSITSVLFSINVSN